MSPRCHRGREAVRAKFFCFFFAGECKPGDQVFNTAPRRGRRTGVTSRSNSRGGGNQLQRSLLTRVEHLNRSPAAPPQHTHTHTHTHLPQCLTLLLSVLASFEGSERWECTSQPWICNVKSLANLRSSVRCSHRRTHGRQLFFFFFPSSSSFKITLSSASNVAKGHFIPTAPWHNSAGEEAQVWICRHFVKVEEESSNPRRHLTQISTYVEAGLFDLLG